MHTSGRFPSLLHPTSGHKTESSSKILLLLPNLSHQSMFRLLIKFNYDRYVCMHRYGGGTTSISMPRFLDQSGLKFPTLVTQKGRLAERAAVPATDESCDSRYAALR